MHTILHQNSITKKRNISSLPPAKPFVKWAGGKGQLLGKFRDLYPFKLQKGRIQNYYEPFVGGGAVFFDVMQSYSIKNAYLYDVNEDLVLTYKVIQKDVEKLLETLFQIQNTFTKLSKERRNEFYYNLRNNYNLESYNINYRRYSEDWILRASQLIFLNRTCFNGLYRINSKGDFNSPAGNYTNPNICNEENLMAVNRILLKANIEVADFSKVINDIKDNAFVYFDPPYRPISQTASFKSYCKNGFSDLDQISLGHLFKKLDKKQSKLMLSNSDPKNVNSNDNFFDDLYQRFNILRIPAKRIINSDPNKRGKINEIVVTNYRIR